MATTLTIEDSTLERFKALKQELDREQSSVPDHTNESFLKALMDTWEAADNGYYDDGTEEIQEQLNEVQEMLESAQDSWEYLNAEELHGTVHQSDEQIKRIINRIDDLENRLPAEVAEELQR